MFRKTFAGCGWPRLPALAGLVGCLGLATTLSQDEGDPGPPPIPRKDFTDVAEFTVIRVVSGDTIIVRAERASRQIGLLGVQAPPLSKPFGPEARRLLEGLLSGETVFLEYPQGPIATDRFGRHPAYVYRAPDGLFVNLEALRQGFAQVADKPEHACGELFKYYAERAREHRKGQWGSAVPARVEMTATMPAVARGGARATSAPADDVVYVTVTGTKYHRPDCSHLRKNATPLALKDARARGYDPCSQCKPPP